MQAYQTSGAGTSTIENHRGVQMVPDARADLVQLRGLGNREWADNEESPAPDPLGRSWDRMAVALVYSFLVEYYLTGLAE